VLLKLFTLSQAENYKIRLKNKQIKKYWIKLALVSVPIFIGLFLLKFLPALAIIEGVYIIIIIFWLGKYLNYRTKLKFTYRATISYIISGYIPTLISIILLFFVNSRIVLFGFLFGYFAILPLYQSLVFTIINPIFIRNNKRFINKNITKLNKMQVIKIAITGSFGKTSCKNILKQILAQKFKVYATPSNYNTPMGIALSIENMPEDTQIFIMEMGARNVGDIDELCNLFTPDYGIITGVSDQHLEIFKSIENIYNEKFELAKHIDDNGLCVFNGNNRYTLKMYKNCVCPRAIIRLNKFADYYAKNIKLGSFGSKFEIYIKNSILGCQTILLGRHNIQNVLMCVAIAKQLCLENNEIIDGIKSLKFVPHRLQLSRSNNINIIDDSYNSNMIGIKYAIECLAKFDTRKVVLSQGVVETGVNQKSDNVEIGKLLGRVSDIIILVGINTNYLLEGIKSYDINKVVHCYASLDNAKKELPNILEAGDTFLIQNDLPDTYN